MNAVKLLTRLRELGITIQLVNDKLKISGAESKLTPGLIDELKNRKAELIVFLQEKVGKKLKYGSIDIAEKKEYYELSSAQKRLYILQQLEIDNISYNLTCAFTFETAVDTGKLEEIFRKLVLRHESLRTSFQLIGGAAVQRIHDDVGLEIQYCDLAPLAVDGFITDFVRPFDLSKIPLLRVGVIKVKELSQILVIDMHHIISDGTSHNILIEEFLGGYQGRKLHGLKLQYKDYSEWRRTGGVQRNLKKQESYWLKRFEGHLPVLNLQTDFARQAVQDFEGDSIRFEIGTEETGALNRIALEERATLFMVLLAIFNIFLSKICGQEDIVVGIPTAGRGHTDLQKIIGLFLNILALRNYPKAEKTFKEFLNEVKENTLNAFENQDYQFEELVDKVVKTRDISRNPLFDVMLILQNMDEPKMNIDNLRKEGSELNVKNYAYRIKISKFDLNLQGIELRGKIFFTLDYRTKLFRRETIELFIKYFNDIVSHAINHPGKQIAQLSIEYGEAKESIIAHFNDDLRYE